MGEIDEVFTLRGHTDPGDRDVGLAPLHGLQLLGDGAHDLDVIGQAQTAGDVGPEFDAKAGQGRALLHDQGRERFGDHADVCGGRRVGGGHAAPATGQPPQSQQEAQEEQPQHHVVPASEGGGGRRSRPGSRGVAPRPAGSARCMHVVSPSRDLMRVLVSRASSSLRARPPRHTLPARAAYAAGRGADTGVCWTNPAASM
jgi:hypothetical protein